MKDRSSSVTWLWLLIVIAIVVLVALSVFTSSAAQGCLGLGHDWCEETPWPEPAYLRYLPFAANASRNISTQPPTPRPTPTYAPTQPPYPTPTS